MPQENKTVQLNLRLQPTLKEAAEKAAAQDHRSLTSLIEKLLADHLRTRPTLEEWHERALARLYGAVSDKKSDQAKLGTLARSYCVHTKHGDKISPSALANTLRSVHASLGSTVPRGDLFYVYHNNPALIPYFTSDSRLSKNGTEEILEFLAIDTMINRIGFWRVSPVGLATAISDHVEDRDSERHRAYGLHPGKWFWPFRLTCNLVELVLHASSFGQKFPSAERAEFRCEWSGLLERQISDPEQMGYDSGQIARVDHRITVGEWPVSELGRSWPEIVSALGSPMMRLFDNDFDYSPEFIRQYHLPRLRA